MSSEERELPATARKLLKAREKGQVAQSQDLTTAIALTTSVAFLMGNLGDFLAELQAIWRIPVDFSDAGVEVALRETSSALISACLGFIIPLFVCVVVSAILANMLVQRGFVISFFPLMPDLNRVNPFTGLANLFSLHKLIDLIKALFKLAVLGIGGAMVFSGFINQLMWVPRCGIGCAELAWEQLVKLIAGVAIVMFAINGLIDMRLQIWLFLRGQRMSKTERKQETKNQTQSPEVRSALRRHARSIRAGEGKGGLQNASLVIGDKTLAIGIRFVRNETPAPICICKARGAAARRMIIDADKIGLPVHFDTTLTDALFPHVKAMGFLPSSSYPALAQLFKEYKIL